MEAVKIENLSFCYPNREGFALKELSLSIERGQFITLIGASGSGKTTLLRHLKPALTPAGERSGRVLFMGEPIEGLSLREQTRRIGFVFQNPDGQIVTDRVSHELAFGLESLGTKNEEIRLRVAETAAFFGIENWFRREVSSLSGGQKQLLNLASVMTMRPELLVLDEPTGQLDPIAASEFLHMLRRINQELGTTVILSEHRTEEAIPISDGLMVMESGRLIAGGTPFEVAKALGEHEMLFAMPTPMRVWAAAGGGEACPADIREGRAWLEDFSRSRGLLPVEKTAPVRNSAEDALAMKDVWFRYSRDGADVLRGFSAKIRRGEIFALLGGNGAGKSTALSIMAGTLSPYRGKCVKNGRTALLPQDPRTLFLHGAVESDLKEAVSDKKPSSGECDALLAEIMETCGIEDILAAHPYDLSGGQIQMAALAKLLLTEPDILLLDEPTKGLDAVRKLRLGALLCSLCERGKTVVIVSHDIEFCALYAHRCAMLFDGGISAAQEPEAFFAGKSFYTTAAGRMSQGILEGAILTEQIIKACGGTPPNLPESKEPCRPNPPEGEGKPPKGGGTKGREGKPPPAPPRKRTKTDFFSALVFLVLIPLTAVLGLEFFGERRFYFVSLLLILEAMLPLFRVFEKRRPRAREIVLVAVLCALAVTGRLAFYMTMQLKPTLAIIILAGACFGAETGFVVGAMTALVSNFFFGQGPWTPWQMFAMGLAGFLAGVLFFRLKLPKKKAALCGFGLLAGILYGAVMNPASVLLSQAHPTMEAIAAAFVLALPMDLLHCAATAAFLFLISGPVIERLERIKLKFGIVLSG